MKGERYGKLYFLLTNFFAFGKDTENDAGKYVKRFGGSKVLIHYGDGSVIDSSKAIAAGTIYDGDFWDFYMGKRIEEALSIGTILTIAAAGSEGSPDSVITKEEGMFKRRRGNRQVDRRSFAYYDPRGTKSYRKS